MAGTIDLQVPRMVLAGAPFAADVFVRGAAPGVPGAIEVEQVRGLSVPPVRVVAAVITSSSGGASATFNNLVFPTVGPHTVVAHFLDCQPDIEMVVVS
jgi:hypothetical protein